MARRKFHNTNAAFYHDSIVSSKAPKAQHILYLKIQNLGFNAVKIEIDSSTLNQFRVYKAIWMILYYKGQIS